MNADIRYYVVRGSGSAELTRVNTSHVGQNISTKAVGSSAVNIITDQYKFREGSTSERAALLGESTVCPRSCCIDIETLLPFQLIQFLRRS